jgi:hypothetical protein
MDALVQFPRRCAHRDKFLHVLELIFTSSFESARVMKDETRVALEDQFIIDVVVPTLVGVCQECSYSACVHTLTEDFTTSASI